MYAEYAVIAVIAIAILALALGGLALHRTRKRAATKAGSKAAPKAEPALVDFRELADLHPELKDAYRDAVVDKLLPAAVDIVNAEWTRHPEAERTRASARMEAAATKIEARLGDADFKREATAILRGAMSR